MGTTSRQGPLKPPICVLHAPSIYALQGSMMFGSYMIQISIHRRKGAWIFKSPLGGEPSTDPKYLFYLSVQFSSVTQSCLTLCDPRNCSMPGLPVHHQLPESTQTHVHWAGDAIQSSHPLSSPSPPALNLSQHQGLFKWVSSFASGGQSIGVSASTSVLPMNTQDWSHLGWTGWISLQSKGLSRVFSNTTVQKHQFFGA